MSLAISNGQFQKYVKRADSEMKIAIAGTGAMGSVYAALLKDAGNEVWAVDTWQAHVEEINKNGLRVEGASGDRTVSDLNATTDIADAGLCDLYIIATKADGVGAAAQEISKIMGKDSLILTIQNGLGAGERIAQFISTENVLLGVAEGFGASMKGPGQIKPEDGAARAWLYAHAHIRASRFDDVCRESLTVIITLAHHSRFLARCPPHAQPM